MDKFNTESVMDKIRKDIADRNLNFCELSYITPYHNRLIKRIREKSRIIIFGAGVYGKIVLEDLIMCGINTICCFCDNKSTNDLFEGYRVLEPEKAIDEYPDATFVVTPKCYENEITAQLFSMGVSLNNIVIFTVEETGLTLL